MNLLKNLADSSQKNSISNKFRGKRFKFFLKFISDLPRPVSILDTGGTVSFWKQMNFSDNPGLNITILNLDTREEISPGITFIKGDARNLSRFKDKEFDVVFSNS